MILWFWCTRMRTGSLGKPAREALAAAMSLQAALGGSKLTVGLVGADVQGAADAIATCGADRFRCRRGAFAQSRHATDAGGGGHLPRAPARRHPRAGTSRWCRTLPGGRTARGRARTPT
jgi:electron transfer flavoprotein alpha subunit